MQDTRSVWKVRMHHMLLGELQTYSTGGSIVVYFEPAPLWFTVLYHHMTEYYTLQVPELIQTPIFYQMRGVIRDGLSICTQEADHQRPFTV